MSKPFQSFRFTLLRTFSLSVIPFVLLYHNNERSFLPTPTALKLWSFSRQGTLFRLIVSYCSINHFFLLLNQYSTLQFYLIDLVNEFYPKSWQITATHLPDFVKPSQRLKYAHQYDFWLVNSYLLVLFWNGHRGSVLYCQL